MLFVYPKFANIICLKRRYTLYRRNTLPQTLEPDEEQSKKPEQGKRRNLRENQ